MRIGIGSYYAVPVRQVPEVLGWSSTLRYRYALLPVYTSSPDFRDFKLFYIACVPEKHFKMLFLYANLIVFLPC